MLPTPQMQAIRTAFITTMARPLGTRTGALVVAILLLNLLDGFATLRHLHHGAEELNPLMLWLLRRGNEHFLVAKHLLASLGVMGIAMHGEVRAARVALWILFPLYSSIGIYQIALFAYIT